MKRYIKASNADKSNLIYEDSKYKIWELSDSEYRVEELRSVNYDGIIERDWVDYNIDDKFYYRPFDNKAYSYTGLTPRQLAFKLAGVDENATSGNEQSTRVAVYFTYIDSYDEGAIEDAIESSCRAGKFSYESGEISEDMCDPNEAFFVFYVLGDITENSWTSQLKNTITRKLGNLGYKVTFIDMDYGW